MIVADTNLLVYLFLPGEHTEAAERVLRKDGHWAAPVLWQSEFRNVLALFLRRSLITEDAALAAFQAAERAVHGREHLVPTERVLELVRRSSCSAYDCEFVALAEKLSVPLVTSDSRVLREFPEVAVTPEEFAAGDRA